MNFVNNKVDIYLKLFYNKNMVYVVAGPTAVGKTKYGIELAKKYNGEIVSLDSVQVYKGLDIGSAKVTYDEMESIPHYMISEIDPNINININMFKDMAIKYIDDIIRRGKTPILVGGTGFYIRAVLYDTSFPYENEDEKIKIREELNNLYEEKGIDYIYNELKKIDLDSYKNIERNNVRRIIRAIEFYRLHNKPISLYNEEERKKKPKYEYKYYVLNMDRDKLYDRINRRVDKMIKNGLLIEIKDLIDNYHLTKDNNSMNAIGYKELYDFVNTREKIKNINELNDEDRTVLNGLIETIKKNSRNYAKRQLTWFLNEENIEEIMLNGDL